MFKNILATKSLDQMVFWVKIFEIYEYEYPMLGHLESVAKMCKFVCENFFLKKFSVSFLPQFYLTVCLFSVFLATSISHSSSLNAFYFRHHILFFKLLQAFFSVHLSLTLSLVFYPLPPCVRL